MAAWWGSDRLTANDKIEWCAAALDGIVSAPLADTVPPDVRDQWLATVESDVPLNRIDEPQPRVYRMNAYLVAFIDANC